MEVLRFDPEVSVPIAGTGSGDGLIRLGPLAGSSALSSAQVLHVPAGAASSLPPARGERLLAVTCGEGWAAASDGRGRTALKPGDGVRWAPGEAAEVGSDAGMTAVLLVGELSVEAFAVTQEVVVEPYDAGWPTRFEEVRAFVEPAVSGMVATRVEHVGSTAVPGLAAKPVIDVDVVVATEDDVSVAVERLAALGYRWRGDLGVRGRQAFAPPAAVSLPRHHLYVVVEGNRAHQDHWLLRDLLRSDAMARERYAACKRENARRCDGNIDVYVAAKAALVAELLTQARAERGLETVEYWIPR